ncbi:folliculin-interacting protein N-terminus-domain-containing protein [Aspergillus spinulosporus]
MLGRLLNTAASTLNPSAYSSRPTPQLESVTEEEHTSGLLFPDASVLRRSNTHAFPLQTAFNSPNVSAAGAYDDRGGVELDPQKDFRVVIAQNSLGDREPCILLDTRAETAEPPPSGPGLESQASENLGHRHARTMSSLSRGRRGHLSQSSLIDQSPLASVTDMRRASPTSSSAFVRARGRSSTMAPVGGLQEPAHSRQATDMNDAGLLNCIFGSSAFSYRGSSTKMHIISGDDDAIPAGNASPGTRNSFTRSYTTGGFASTSRADYKPRSKVTILLTRMFSVNLPEAGTTSEGRDLGTSLIQESLPETGYPFPDVTKRKKIKEKKTPMYAVAITIQIPVLSRNTARPVSRFSAQGQDSPKPGMSCSLDSDYRWRGGFFDENLASAPASLDERIDMLVDHWDVINRTLSHLERLSRKEILFLLKRADSSGMHPKPAKPPNMQRTNQTFLHLPANVLALNSRLKQEASRSARRISTALQIPNVITGQSRWGVWREEGRSIVRSLGDKDHSFFFLVLITAFLGNHTEWLNALGPDWYRRRHYLQQKAQQDAEPALPYRTVIVSPDKMTARRLIFLLSAFLPPKQRFEPLPSPLRPGTSASTRAVSQSPPSVPVLRQEPLRRAIERRSRAQRLNLADRDHNRSVSASSNETAHRSTDDAEHDFSIYRRGSDARSVRTIGIPMHPKDARTKNTSTATISTANPGGAVPVPHFASQGREPSDQTCGEGVDSLASETLLKSLQRSESSTNSVNSSVPTTGGRWGSLFSGLWGSRQESSTDYGTAGQPLEHRRRSTSVLNVPPKRNPTTLQQMVEEASSEEPHQIASSATISIPQPSNAQRKFEEDAPDLSSSTTDNPRETSLRLAVREEDGIVDVELPLPGFVSLSSSGESTMTSPKKTRTSITSLDALGSTHSSGSGFHYQTKDVDGPTLNVAGWLKNFHDDFVLQGVRPYSSLESEIRRAMQSEPTPSNAVALDTDGSEKWVDVATTLIADVRTFSVKRLRLKRRAIGGGSVRSPMSPSGMSTPGTPRQVPGGSMSTSQLSGYFSSAMISVTPSPRPRFDGYNTGEVEERFVEEPVMDLDGTLVDALERVLAQSGPSSLAPTRASSPSRSRKENDRPAEYTATRDDVPSLEAPRTECRRLVLGALEEVVRSVTAEHCREDDGELNLTDRERKRVMTGVDNTLREGIRKWLLDVEEAW